MTIVSAIRHFLHAGARLLLAAVLAAGMYLPSFARCDCEEGSPPSTIGPKSDPGYGGQGLECDPWPVAQILNLPDSEIAKLLATTPHSIIINGFDRASSQLLLGHILSNRTEAAAIIQAARGTSSVEERNTALDAIAASISTEIAALTAQLADGADPQAFQLLAQAYARLLTVNSIRTNPLLGTLANWCR